MQTKQNKTAQGEHVSSSEYWNFKNIKKEVKIKKILNILRLIKKIFEKLFNISITRKSNINYHSYSYIEKGSRITHTKIIKKRNVLLAKKFSLFLKKLGIKRKKKFLETLIIKHDRFFFKKNIVKDNYGGISYNNSLMLFVFSSSIKVENIIESGVWKGFTSSIFDQALKGKKKFCFDINFSKLVYRSKNAEYINFDIEKYNFKSNKIFSNCLAFFDDHVSQYDRFLFCKKRKIPYVVFDDDNDYFTIHSDGWTSIPTISMIKNIYNINSNLKWKSSNRSGFAKFQKINSSILNDYYYCKAPDLFDLTGYYNQSPMSFMVRKGNK